MGSLWAGLSLRVQAAIAVVLPCVAVALFASIYFPSRLNEQAGEALERQAVSVGQLSVNNAAPIMRLIRDGLATPSELNGIFEGVRAGGNVTQLGALAVTKDVTRRTPEGKRFVKLEVGEGKTTQLQGDLPSAEYEIPEPGQCHIKRGAVLDVRCSAKDQDYEAAMIIRFSLENLAAQQRENQIVGVWVLLAAVVLGLMLALLISGAIAGPLGVVSRVAREVAAGDVTVRQVDVGGATEIQSMAASVNDMLASLRTLVGQMVDLTGRLGEAAKGLNVASNDQTHVTSQQSAYAQQIAATFEELSRTAESITRSTEVVEAAALRTNTAVDEARAVVAEMVGGMTEIRRESKEIADAITRLNGDVQQVSRIAQVIKQVADRSDLLALNAALEGTKAGEVGRGFSVVAAEMRKLAENVAQSARDIGRIVENVQSSGDVAVLRAKEGVESSDRGMAVAERAQTAFQQIVELSRGTKEAAQQIAVATRQQRQSSEQAVQGARNVADLVKQGVDATGRTTRIAQDLQSSVDALTTVTGRFKVADRN
ncbi:MAG: methyl-accepting chemotaxis protein [Archangium gephyra]|uniref:Methyl-accepting chemotaxis protein n=1 Tax=Archangium gephyra TaxID=48 RepID=A0A2W5T0L8_9BACT|nr:MAG: methyl-accepting chemotaxis protein [Archangium gephyra]